MATHAPEACFKFAADQISPLREIFYRLEGLPESELRQLIIRFCKPEHPASDYIFRQQRDSTAVCAGLRSGLDESAAEVLQCLDDYGLGLEQEVLRANLEVDSWRGD